MLSLVFIFKYLIWMWSLFFYYKNHKFAQKEKNKAWKHFPVEIKLKEASFSLLSNPSRGYRCHANLTLEERESSWSFSEERGKCKKKGVTKYFCAGCCMQMYFERQRHRFFSRCDWSSVCDFFDTRVTPVTFYVLIKTYCMFVFPEENGIKRSVCFSCEGNRSSSLFTWMSVKRKKIHSKRKQRVRGDINILFL